MEKPGGFVVIHRGIFKNPMLPDARHRDFFIWLICQAAWREKTIDVNGKPFVLQRGQLWTSIPHIKRELGVTDRNARTLLDRLEKWQAIRQKSDRRGRIITICNYEKYQDKEKINDRQTTDTATGRRQTGDRQATASKQREQREQREQEEVPSADAPGSKYAFEGDVIRLTHDDFRKWEQGFSNLHLRAELLARDAYLASDASDADRKRWFISTSKYLANRNAEAMAQASDASTPSGKPARPDVDEHGSAMMGYTIAKVQ